MKRKGLRSASPITKYFQKDPGNNDNATKVANTPSPKDKGSQKSCSPGDTENMWSFRGRYRWEPRASGRGQGTPNQNSYPQGGQCRGRFSQNYQFHGGYSQDQQPLGQPQQFQGHPGYPPQGNQFQGPQNRYPAQNASHQGNMYMRTRSAGPCQSSAGQQGYSNMGPAPGVHYQHQNSKIHKAQPAYDPVPRGKTSRESEGYEPHGGKEQIDGRYQGRPHEARQYHQSFRRSEDRDRRDDSSSLADEAPVGKSKYDASRDTDGSRHYHRGHYTEKGHPTSFDKEKSRNKDWKIDEENEYTSKQAFQTDHCYGAYSWDSWRHDRKRKHRVDSSVQDDRSDSRSSFNSEHSGSHGGDRHTLHKDRYPSNSQDAGHHSIKHSRDYRLSNDHPHNKYNNVHLSGRTKESSLHQTNPVKDQRGETQISPPSKRSKSDYKVRVKVGEFALHSKHPTEVSHVVQRCMEKATGKMSEDRSKLDHHSEPSSGARFVVKTSRVCQSDGRTKKEDKDKDDQGMTSSTQQQPGHWGPPRQNVGIPPAGLPPTPPYPVTSPTSHQMSSLRSAEQRARMPRSRRGARSLPGQGGSPRGGRGLEKPGLRQQLLGRSQSREDKARCRVSSNLTCVPVSNTIYSSTDGKVNSDILQNSTDSNPNSSACGEKPDRAGETLPDSEKIIPDGTSSSNGADKKDSTDQSRVDFAGTGQTITPTNSKVVSVDQVESQVDNKNIMELLNDLPEETLPDHHTDMDSADVTDDCGDSKSGAELKDSALHTDQNRPSSPDSGLEEFDLEEVEHVPVLSQGDKRERAPSTDSQKDGCVVGESVQKGLQNLRNIFKGGVSAASPKAGSGACSQDPDSDRSQQSQPTDPRHREQSGPGSPDGFDLSMSEDSDDDDLLDAPSILKKLKDLSTERRKSTESSSQPKVLVTPTDSECETEPVATPTPLTLDTVSLDNLLSEREKMIENDRQLEKMEVELQKGIQQGGVRSLTVEETDDLLPEHQQNIKKMRVAEQMIKEHHPGEVVLHPARREKLFTYPGSLTLQSCGFEPGGSFIDKNLTTLGPALIAEMLTSDVISLCFHAISCQHAFLSWLLQLMHKNRLVVQKAHEIIYNVLRRTDIKAANWIPDRSTIERIFINLGAHPDAICPQWGTLTSADTPGTASAEIPHQEEPPAEGDAQHQGALVENLRLVLHVLADAVYLRSELYQEADLIAIIIMVFKISLDKQLNQKALDYDIQVCLSSLIYAIKPDEWPNKVLELCKVVSELASHHHNQLHMASLLPPCERGRYLQRRLAYTMLHKTLRKEVTPENVLNMRVHHLHRLLAGVQIKGVNVDHYLVSSLITMVNLAVGNETLHKQEKEDLSTLINILRNKSSEVRDSMNIIDQTLVKDQMIRLSSKWTVLLQNMGSKERTIFAYTTVKEPVRIESVVARDQEDSDPENDAEILCMETD